MFEVWDSGSDSKMFSTPDLSEALKWVQECGLREGDAAIGGLRIADDQEGWAISGVGLRSMVQRYEHLTRWRDSMLRQFFDSSCGKG